MDQSEREKLLTPTIGCAGSTRNAGADSTIPSSIALMCGYEAAWHKDATY